MRSRLLTSFCSKAFLAASLTVCAQASVIFDSGYITFSATGSQFGRIARDGISSTWGSTKTFPGVINAPTPLGNEVFTVNSGIYEFLQISLDDPLARLFVAAFLGSFTPVNSAPNYGLDVNYLGDPGSSQPFGNPSFFQIQVPQNTLIVLPVNEITLGGGAGATFDLLVEGFVDSNFGEAPEPAPFWLCAAGVAALAAVRIRVSRGATRQ